MTPLQLRRAGASHSQTHHQPVIPAAHLPATGWKRPSPPGVRCSSLPPSTTRHTSLLRQHSHYAASSFISNSLSPPLFVPHRNHQQQRQLRHCRTTTRAAQTTPSSTSTPQPTNTTAPQPPPLSPSTVPYEARVVGCLLGAACGDVLGHPLEGLGPPVITAKRAQGNVDFHLSSKWELAGKYSGDTQLLLGVTRSLVNTGGRVDPADVAREHVTSHDPWRGYREWDQRVLEALADGDSWEETGRKYLLGGWSPSGAARIAPIGLVLRNASNAQLLQAVTDAICVTHTHPTGIEAAFAQAMAIKALARQGPEAASPEALLRHLMDRCREEDLKKRFKLMLMWLPHLHALGSVRPGITDWGAFLTSPEYEIIIKVRRMIAEEQQNKGTQAVACALWALTCCWDAPEDAVVLSTHLGGLTHTVAALTGALVGALHGAAWLPARWVSNLENGAGGRDEIIMLARRLAALDGSS